MAQHRSARAVSTAVGVGAEPAAPSVEIVTSAAGTAVDGLQVVTRGAPSGDRRPAREAAVPAARGRGATSRSGEPGHPSGAAAAPESLPVRDGETPWTAEELAAVRADLVAELERLENDVAVLEANVASVMRESGDGAGDDQADTGSKAYGREQELTFLTNTRGTLYQARHALERIDRGVYGSCETCRGAIGKLRLQAFPRATLCMACKQRQERR